MIEKASWYDKMVVFVNDEGDQEVGCVISEYALGMPGHLSMTREERRSWSPLGIGIERVEMSTDPQDLFYRLFSAYDKGTLACVPGQLLDLGAWIQEHADELRLEAERQKGGH